ncbi:MAG: helix-turn-helix domain-containing protein [Ruminococcus sp.]|nr:helix-turn-helix domain-containing protein [Ruminococcus sp.]
MTIGDIICSRRKELGLTLEEIGNATGVSKSTVKKWENGFITNMRKDKIESLARVLNIDPLILIQGVPKYGKQLKTARNKYGLSISELADRTGISESDLTDYEEDTLEPSMDELSLLSEAYGISRGELLWNNFDRNSSDDFPQLDNIKPVQLKRFPMLGEIACGEPIWADEDHESYVMADMDIKADFCLRAKGDSMINARIYDGDIVFIKEMPIVNNGDIAAVIIDNEATLKRFYYDRENNYLQLIAENPQYKPLVYRDAQLDEIRVLGKAVYFMSAL